MPLPTIVANTQVKILDAETVQALITQKKLTFTMQGQQQTEWCWAAVAASVSAYFNPQSTWTQCAIVQSQQLTGCTDCSTPACNQEWYLSWALSQTGNLASTQRSTEPYHIVTGEVNASRPLCCRIAWKCGGAHYVALYGYHTVRLARYVDVADPLYGESTYAFGVFTNAYQHAGSWANTYFVQSGAEASTCP
ncbi:MAG TPA: papain-like cysteine protease family protein [Longimicrobium sp.]|nr:papain-like cysteine protease family protein [Longimicrobium sp.]